MAFDQPTRNRLAAFVAEGRAILSREFTQQLQGDYGLNPASGEVMPLESMQLDNARRATARLLRETLDYYLLAAPTRAGARARQDALQRIVREQAFTVLNRLCALRMAEARGLLIESVARGYQSRGFQLYNRLAGSGLGETGDAYRAYLFSLCDEFAVDLRVLFDRFSPEGRLFPGEKALLDLLAAINHPDLEALWAADETVGWIYQYFNSQEERRQMRAESQAPRNSRELAVRNQFFTPRYVVEFLTDNTLGRTWYEMTMGRTELAERCRYLVRRPDEVFLSPWVAETPEALAWLEGRGSEQPGSEQPGDQRPDWFVLAHSVDGYRHSGLDLGEGWPQVEERLAALRTEGGAAGFTTQELLDLLFLLARAERFGDWGPDEHAAEIEAAVAAIESRVRSAGAGELSQEELLRQPVLIPYRAIKDPRTILMLDPACGSMHFGLYAFDLYEVIYAEAWDIEEAGSDELLRPADLRPLREIYPDKAALLRDVPRLIVEYNIHGIDIDPRAVQIAGLSLWLRAQRSWHDQGVKPAERKVIEHSNIVCAEPMPGDREALQEFAAGLEPKLLGELVTTVFEKMELAGEAGSLLKIEEEIRSAVEAAQARATTLFDLPAPEQFWAKAEDLVVKALREYAAGASNGHSYRRRLFAHDAEQGFAFIDVCRKRYDVVLMNPPFGEASVASRTYFDSVFPNHKTELLACFVSRWLLALKSSGMEGVLSSRTMLVNANSEPLRREIAEQEGELVAFADLGYGVLDAMVEAAAYVIRRSHSTDSRSIFFHLLKDEDKDQALRPTISDIASGNRNGRVYDLDLAIFANLFRFPWAYWLPNELIKLFDQHDSLEDNFARVRVGSSTADNFRFLRLSWEVARRSIGQSPSDTFHSQRWISLAKGGEYWPFYDDLHLLLNWTNGGSEVEATSGATIRSPDDYFIPGCTYPYRTTSAFSLRAIPLGSIFADGGPAILPSSGNTDDNWLLLGYFNTRFARYLLEVFLGEGDAVSSGSAARNYIPRAVGAVPIPNFQSMVGFTDTAKRWYQGAIRRWLEDETSRVFKGFPIRDKVSSITQGAMDLYASYVREALSSIRASWECEQMLISAYSFSELSLSAIVSSFGYHPCEYEYSAIEASSAKSYFNLSMDALVDRVAADYGGGRAITKKSFYADRRLELVSHALRANVVDVVEVLRRNKLMEPGYTSNYAERLLSWFWGCPLGRWDIRRHDESEIFEQFLDPFTPLPICPPGMLQNARGLPATPEDVPADYPLRISWPGILVDDMGHPEDIEARVREALQVVWGQRAGEIEQEVCAILGVRSLRVYFGDLNCFFADHLSRYSKSRRTAPIYWPLSTPSGSYTLWLYYHRLTDQTLYRCVNDFVEPKRKEVSEQLDALRRKTGRSREEERSLERLAALDQELAGFRAELLRVAAFWKPNLNDGVQITAAPLYRLFNHRPWRKRLQETWEALEAGEYDWAHLAYSIWPDRVREKCRADKSLAIAHDLEHLYVEPPATKAKGKRGKGKAPQSAEAQDAATQSALELGDVD